MNRSKGTHLKQMRWGRIVGASLSLVVAAGTAWSANDFDTPNPRGTTNRDGSNTFNTVWLGHNDLQGRTTYQTTVHTQGNRVIAYAGHFAGTMLNPMTGVVEQNGTSIVDVTDPRHPKYLKHLPSSASTGGGSRMAKLCDGNDLPSGKRNHFYLLRENGAASQEVWDVTDPSDPTLVSTPLTGQDVTHRNWWDCTTGIAYIVAGATKPTDGTFVDGWNTKSSPNQHLKIFDLSDPRNPKFILEFGYPGQNPGSTFVMPGTTNVVPPGVHGPIVVSTFKGQAINRLYMPYGVGSDGIIQINDLTKVLPSPYGMGVYADVHKPTDRELLQGQIGVLYMPGGEGGHSTMPLYGIKLKQYQNFTNNNVRDIMAVSSEETDNRCTGSPHLMYLLDITNKVAQGGSTSAEQHPWPISTVTVDDFSGRPNFCSRGTRFGVHSPAENFEDPSYARLLTSAWFDAGIRVTDIRDPYHPQEVAHFIAPVNHFTQASSAVINGVKVSALDVSCDNTDVDNRGIRYCGDRVGGGLDIVGLTGDAEDIQRNDRDDDDNGDRGGRDGY